MSFDTGTGPWPRAPEQQGTRVSDQGSEVYRRGTYLDFVPDTLRTLGNEDIDQSNKPAWPLPRPPPPSPLPSSPLPSPSPMYPYLCPPPLVKMKDIHGPGPGRLSSCMHHADNVPTPEPGWYPHCQVPAYHTAWWVRT